MENKVKKTVVVGLSGGVDSSVSALFLKKQGYNVIGAFMKNFSDTKNPATGECSYLEDKKMAQKIAILLNIQFVVFDFEREYKKMVINPMFRDYEKGLTPNPDMLCNKIIKFPLFWKEAKKLGADYIAFGHYAGIKKAGSEFQLLAGKDRKKDQSYFLAELTQNDLSHTLFPLARYKKEKVREIARKNKFPNWNRHGTVGICFVGQLNMHSLLKTRIEKKQGRVLDINGNEIGMHEGNAYYTIGQKAGPNIGIVIKKPKAESQKRFYIAEKKKGNILVIAPKGSRELKRKEVRLENLHLINKILKKSKLKAKIRHRGILHSGKLVKNNKKYKFVFNKPVESIAEGQFLVMYDKNKVVGAAEIRLK